MPLHSRSTSSDRQNDGASSSNGSTYRESAAATPLNHQRSPHLVPRLHSNSGLIKLEPIPATSMPLKRGPQQENSSSLVQNLSITNDQSIASHKNGSTMNNSLSLHFGRRSIASSSARITKSGRVTGAPSSSHQAGGSSKGSGSTKQKAKKSPQIACCSVSLAVVFGAACVAIAAVFSAITVVSTVTFTNQVKSSVKENLGTAMQGAMKYVTDPLQQSFHYAEQLKTMIESSPARYACDDSVLNFPGSTPTQNFIYETGMYGLQHTNVAYIYQSRYSKTHLRPDGLGPAGTCCMVGPSQKLVYYMINNTQYVSPYANGSYFESLATQTSNAPSFLDITQLSIIKGPAATNTSRWVSASVSPAAGLSVPTNKYTYLTRVEEPSDPSSIWVVGIDHNMITLKSILLQATPPISVGDSITTPTQVDGAHTTMYDLNEGLIMASTHPDVPVYLTYGVLFKAGESPAATVNDAYHAAVRRCGQSGCAKASVSLGKSEIHTAYRIVDAAAKLDLLMVSSVPRDYFFASSDRTFGIILGLSISCCVAIMAACIALLLLIRSPLSSLKENMMKAAALHNHEVEKTISSLSEISALSKVFDGMNQQLLIARSFVPEAVLLGKTEDSHDADDDDEGTLEEKSTTHHSRQLSSVSPSGGHRSGFNAGMYDDEGTTADGGGTRVSNNSSNGMAKLFNVSEKRVGVLSLNLVGFHALCAPERALTRVAKITDITTTLLTLVVACSHQERGVMDSFHGDHFTLTFNASRSVAGPLAAAVRCANNFVANVHDAFGGMGGFTGVAAGAAAGKAHVGTFGIDGYRRLSVIGEAYRTATALQITAVQYLRMAGSALDSVLDDAGCLVEECAGKELSNCGIRLQAVGCVQNSQQRTFGLKKNSLRTVYLAHLAGPNDLASKTDGEWLYELGEMEASDPYVEPNSAMLALIHGDTELCSEKLNARHVELSKRQSSTTKLTVSKVVDSDDGSASISDSGKSTFNEDHRDAPAWNYVRYCYHRAREFDAALTARSTSATNFVLQQCDIPFLFFQQ